MKRTITLSAALGFIVFIVTIIVIADRGEGGRWWGFIHDIPLGDKVGHLGLIGTLSLLCNLAIPGWKLRYLPRFITAVTAVLLVLLSLEELAQAFLPHRTCDLFDWLADLGGLTLGQALAMWIGNRYYRHDSGPGSQVP
jgi:hypothetical protein